MRNVGTLLVTLRSSTTPSSVLNMDYKALQYHACTVEGDSPLTSSRSVCQVDVTYI